MFTDGTRHTVWNELRQFDLQAFARLLPEAALQQAAQAAGLSRGHSPLSLGTLTWLAISAAWYRTKSFADVLTVTLKLLEDTPGWGKSPLGRRCHAQRSCTAAVRSKHDPRGRQAGVVSEEAFVQARQRMPVAFWMQLLLILGGRFQAQHAAQTQWKSFRLLALDGSDIALPHWKGLRGHFGTCANGRAARKSQARLMLLALPQVRLPWRYELVPQSCHEQTAAARLLQQLQPQDLVLMDRGFWSFGLFCQVRRQQAHFGIRLRRGIPFRTLRRLGRHDRLVRWKPSKGSKRKYVWRNLPDLPRTIDLRVIDYQVSGFRPSAVVTSVLDPAVLSREDWVRMASQDQAGRILEAGLYHRRWEIETMFHELKVTQGMEGHLRSRTPEGIAYEVAGHILLYLLTRWLMLEAALAHGKDPLRLSFKHAWQELTDLRQTLLTASRQRVVQVLLPRLLARIVQHEVPFRPGRHYPRPADCWKKGKYRQKSKHVAHET